MRNKIYIANIGEYTVRNTAHEIVRFCEGKAYEAERMKDYRLMHEYFQHADHWKRQSEDTKNLSGRGA